ncbi:ATP-binding protein [Streptomyces cellostaticus]|uniref:ATP-binding protein n=1 Tax=Streptomyces TaxID=1883 RepID=UPI0020275F1E|nr:ATP-binding protein [Streptomyces cellostaticus]
MGGDTAGHDRPAGAPFRVSAAYEGSTPDIARARELARSFLGQVWSAHGLPVSERASGTVQLVVSELVTNAFKYAPGPCLLDIELLEASVRITVWDSALDLPVIMAPEPGRAGQHGLEIVTALSESFAVYPEPVGKRTVATVPLTGGPGEAAAGRRP